MKPMSKIAGAMLAAALVLMIGCATLGVPTPQTFSEREAAAISTATATLSTARGLLSANKISQKDAANTIKQADNLMEAVNVAETLHASDPRAAEDKLAATIASLNLLRDYLATRK